MSQVSWNPPADPGRHRRNDDPVTGAALRCATLIRLHNKGAFRPMNPTTIASSTSNPLLVQPPVNHPVPSLPPNFPLRLDEAQLAEVNGQLAGMELAQLPLKDIATLGADVEGELQKTLDTFLSRIEKNQQPRIFKLVDQLRESVDKEDLPDLADRILYAKPTLFERVLGLFNKQSLRKAMARAFEEVRLLASGKSKKLSDLIQQMERELQQEQNRLEGEIVAMEQLKTSYQDRFREFALAAALMHGFVEKSKAQFVQIERDPAVDPIQLNDHRDKLQALESRALAIEGTLSRLPSEQLVLRQLQNAGVSTLQETHTTASSRFSSIKFTLINIHAALMVQGVQQLAESNKALDENLAAVQNKLNRTVITSAAEAPGRNRLAQAEQLQAVVQQTRELNALVEQAKARNAEQFAQARAMFAKARDEMTQLGLAIRPDRAL
jgi:hypothetical protein